jgi:carboxyl-terminal processing protease
VQKISFLRTTLQTSVFVFLSLAASLSYAQEQQPLPLEIQEETAVDIDEIHHFISTLALVKHYYLEDVDTEELIDNAIKGMIGRLDPHSSYMNEHYFKQLQSSINGEFSGIGIEIVHENGVIKVVTPIDGTPAAKAGLKPQDLIVRIDGMFVKDMDMELAINKIRGKRGSEVKLTIVREGEKKPLTFEIQRDVIKIKSVKSKLLEDEYGYIKLSTFQNNGRQEILSAISELHKQAQQPLKGLVLDLRNNPGGLLNVAVEIADLFLDTQDMRKNKLIVFTKGKHPESSMQAHATRGEIMEEVPIVVLMNQGSASASEIVAGALQDHNRAIIVGNSSFGKGSVQTIIPTIDGTGAIKLTTALYYTPMGRSIQAKGIVPDLVVSDIQLPDQKTEAVAFIPLTEKDLNDHLKAPNQRNKKASMIAPKENLALAKEDYQLYQALNILKGLSILKNTS